MTGKISPPCQHCPFRARYTGERDYLRPGRRLEIVESVMEGGTFPCHETTTHDNDGNYVHSPKETDCVGLDIVMARDALDGQMVRIRERIGMLDTPRLLHASRKLSMWTWDQIQADAGSEDGETCEVCGPDCEAPAGMMIGGNIVVGTETTDNVCHECGMNVCPSCMEIEEHMCWEYAQQERQQRTHPAWDTPLWAMGDGNYFQPALPESTTIEPARRARRTRPR